MAIGTLPEATDLPKVIPGLVTPEEGHVLLKKYGWDPALLEAARAWSLQRPVNMYLSSQKGSVPVAGDALVEHIQRKLYKLTAEDFDFIVAFPQFGFQGGVEPPVHRDAESYFGRDPTDMVTCFVLLYSTADRQGGELQLHSAKAKNYALQEEKWRDIKYRDIEHWTLSPAYKSDMEVGDCLIFPSSDYRNTISFQKGQRMAFKLIFCRKKGFAPKLPQAPLYFDPTFVLACMQVLPLPYPEWQDVKDKFQYMSSAHKTVSLSVAISKHGALATLIALVFGAIFNAVYFVLYATAVLAYRHAKNNAPYHAPKLETISVQSKRTDPVA